MEPPGNVPFPTNLTESEPKSDTISLGNLRDKGLHWILERYLGDQLYPHSPHLFGWYKSEMNHGLLLIKSGYWAPRTTLLTTVTSLLPGSKSLSWTPFATEGIETYFHRDWHIFVAEISFPCPFFGQCHYLWAYRMPYPGMPGGFSS